jgi:hypothetical protein
MKSKTKDIKSPKRGERYDQDELLNYGLLIARKRGDWAIDEELLRCYRRLRSKQAEEISRLVLEAAKLGCWLVDESVQGSTWVSGKQVMDREDFDAQMRARYPWISEENLSNIYSHGKLNALKNSCM